MFVFPQNSDMETPAPTVTVLEDGACERKSGLDEVVRVGPMGWDWPPYRKRQRLEISPCHMRTQQESSHLLL